jgi:hypothetical protein
MSKRRTREKKSAKPQQPAKPDEISVGRRFAQPYAKTRLLFDHPHSYREWNIVGQYDVPGFFYLESRFRLNPGEQPAIYTAFELWDGCLKKVIRVAPRGKPRLRSQGWINNARSTEWTISG